MNERIEFLEVSWSERLEQELKFESSGFAFRSTRHINKEVVQRHLRSNAEGFDGGASCGKDQRCQADCHTPTQDLLSLGRPPELTERSQQ